MSNLIGITLKDITLDYPIYGTGPKFFSTKLLSIATAGRISSNQSYSYVRALDKINIDLKPGDRLGIIGGNGAGKTSLLKVFAGIFKPTHGKRIISGRITTVLGTGFGLDDESTGYENITLGGITLGYTRREIQLKTKEIEEFTELGNFLELPLKAYSAGMRARLAFAISTAIYPDILIIDEGLGAGDQSFYQKANERFEKFSSNSKILVLASHADDLIKKFCNKAIVMHHGKMEFAGSVDDALKYYNEHIVANS